jgi:thiol-disulfide isomerase/thioredoxin
MLVFFLCDQSRLPQDWKTNFELVKKEAASQSKPIVLVFSGSDWCAPCIKLDKSGSLQNLGICRI